MKTQATIITPEHLAAYALMLEKKSHQELALYLHMEREPYREYVLRELGMRVAVAFRDWARKVPS